jgi:hypothetical protein
MPGSLHVLQSLCLAEESINEQGWDQPAYLMGIHAEPDSNALVLTAMDIGRYHPFARPDGDGVVTVNPLDSLREFAALTERDPHAGKLLANGAKRGEPFIGAAFASEGWIGGDEARSLCAVDIHGNCYLIQRVREPGRVETDMTTVDEISAQFAGMTGLPEVPGLLRRIIAAATAGAP